VAARGGKEKKEGEKGEGREGGNYYKF